MTLTTWFEMLNVIRIPIFFFSLISWTPVRWWFRRKSHCRMVAVFQWLWFQRTSSGCILQRARIGGFCIHHTANRGITFGRWVHITRNSSREIGLEVIRDKTSRVWIRVTLPDKVCCLFKLRTWHAGYNDSNRFIWSACFPNVLQLPACCLFKLLILLRLLSGEDL